MAINNRTRAMISGKSIIGLVVFSFLLALLGTDTVAWAKDDCGCDLTVCREKLHPFTKGRKDPICIKPPKPDPDDSSNDFRPISESFLNCLIDYLGEPNGCTPRRLGVTYDGDKAELTMGGETRTDGGAASFYYDPSWNNEWNPNPVYIVNGCPDYTWWGFAPKLTPENSSEEIYPLTGIAQFFTGYPQYFACWEAAGVGTISLDPDDWKWMAIGDVGAGSYVNNFDSIGVSTSGIRLAGIGGNLLFLDGTYKAQKGTTETGQLRVSFLQEQWGNNGPWRVSKSFAWLDATTREVLYRINPETAARFYKEKGYWPSQLSHFEDSYDMAFTYEDDELVSAVYASAGCGTCGGASGGELNYSYEASEYLGEDYNKWTERREDNARLGGDGDGVVTTYWTNFDGNTLLKKIAIYAGEHSQVSYRYYEYDDAGRPLKEYSPEAISSCSEPAANGTIDPTFNSTSGLIKIWEYYEADANETGDGLSAMYKASSGVCDFNVVDLKDANDPGGLEFEFPSDPENTKNFSVTLKGKIKLTEPTNPSATAFRYTFYIGLDKDQEYSPENYINSFSIGGHTVGSSYMSRLGSGDVVVEFVNPDKDAVPDNGDEYILFEPGIYDIELKLTVANYEYYWGWLNKLTSFEWKIDEWDAVGEQWVEDTAREDFSGDFYSLPRSLNFLKAEKYSIGTSGTVYPIREYQYIGGFDNEKTLSRELRWKEAAAQADEEWVEYAYPRGFYLESITNNYAAPEIVTQTYVDDSHANFTEERRYRKYSQQAGDLYYWNGNDEWLVDANGTKIYREYYDNNSSIYGRGIRKRKKEIIDNSTKTAPSGVTGYVATSGLNLTTQYTYDAETGNLSTLARPDGTVEYYVYTTDDVDSETSGDPGTESNPYVGEAYSEYTFLVKKNPSNYTLLAPVKMQKILAGDIVEEKTVTLANWAVGAANSEPSTAYVDETSDFDLELQKTAFVYDVNGRISELHRYHKYVDGNINSGIVETQSASDYLKTEYVYGSGGTLQQEIAPDGQVTYYTTRYLEYDSTNGLCGTEKRVYHVYKDESEVFQPSGAPVEVTWLDSNDRVVREWTAAWTSSGEPTASVELSDELSRITYAYDDFGRLSEKRTYYDLATPAYYSQEYAYDLQGRLIREEDISGNITATVYDFAGRVSEVWQGTDDSGATAQDPTGNNHSNNNMVKVAIYYHDLDADGSGSDQVGYVTRGKRIAPNVTGEPTGTDYTYTDYSAPYSQEEIEETDQWVKITKPQDSPWTVQVRNLAGDIVANYLYSVDAGALDSILQKQTMSLDGLGRPTSTKVYDQNAIEYYIEGTTGYDLLGRMNRSVSLSDRRIHKKEYDAIGRVVCELICGAEGATSSVSDDVVMEERTYIHDDAGRVILMAVYQRNHDETSSKVGKLSENWSVTDSQASFTAIWYDEAGRINAQAEYGNNGNTQMTSRPATPPASSDNVLVTQYVYASDGSWVRATDPAGVITVTYYDPLGRTSYLVENADISSYPFDPSDESGTGDSSDPTLDRVTKYEYNEFGQLSSQIALDPNGDGVTTDQQVTRYVYSGELADKGCAVASNTLLRAIIYPDSTETVSDDELPSGTHDRVEMTYYADGSLRTREDQRETELTYLYDDRGRLQMVNLTAGGGADDTVQAMTYTYDDLGRVENITTHGATQSDISSPTSVLNQIVREYNGFNMIEKEYQEHEGFKDANSLSVSHTFDTYSSNYKYYYNFRQKYVTYPNDREVHFLYDGHDGRDNILNRANKISTAQTSGDTIAEYQFNGLNRMVKKTHPTPSGTYQDDELSLDYTYNSYAALDRFGRVIRHPWIFHNDLVQEQTYVDDPIFDINYGYDRSSNRLYADRQVYKGASQFYSYDALNRLRDVQIGQLTRDAGAITGVNSYWKNRGQNWTLDQLGNQMAVEDFGQANWYAGQFNAANEYQASSGTNDYSVKAAGKPYLVDGFAPTSTPDYYESVGTDTYSVSSGVLTFSSLTQDSGIGEDDARGIVLFGENIGPHQAEVSFTKASPPPLSSGYAGYVFGYVGDDDYWMLVGDFSDTKMKLYHVQNGVKGTALLEESWPMYSPGTSTISLIARRNSLEGVNYNFPDGFPTGKVGVVSTLTSVGLNSLKIKDDAVNADVLGRWLNGGDYYVASVSGNDCLKVQHTTQSGRKPILLKNLRTDTFQAIFSIRKPLSGLRDLDFVFDAEDMDAFNFLRVHWISSGVMKSTLSGYSVSNGKPSAAVTGTYDNTDTPYLSDSDVLWVKVESDGTNIKAYLKKNGDSFPAQPQYTSANFTRNSGSLGFGQMDYPSGYTAGMSGLCVDQFSVYLSDGSVGWNAAAEIVEEFDINGSGQGETDLAYDAAGNLTFDGRYAYTYDAWNRLTGVNRAYRDTSNDLQTGATIAEIAYDGLGRRISKTITNSGDWDCEYHYYWNDQQLLETRKGLTQTLKQYVWGLTYVDELVQIAINQDPENAISGTNTENHCERFFYVLQDANYNVLGVTTQTGRLIERYEYTPYGQRTVFSHGWNICDLNDDGSVDSTDVMIWQAATSGGGASDVADVNGDGVVDTGDIMVLGPLSGFWSAPADDPLVMQPRLNSAQPEGCVTAAYLTDLCDVGHQGLLLDREFGLYYNRARMLEPVTGRFLQRDPMGYVDGMNLYQYVRSNPLRYGDPDGTFPCERVIAVLQGAGADKDGDINKAFLWNKRKNENMKDSTLRIVGLGGSAGGSGDLLGANMYTEVYIEYKQEYTELYKCCTGGKSGTCKLMWGQPVEATIKGTIDAPNGLLHARITIPLGVPRTRVGANIGLGMDLDYESNSELMNFVRRAVARGDVREVVEWSTGGGGPAGMTRVVSHVKCRSDEAPFPGSPVFKDW